jgi:hypothetical protein
MIFLRKFWHQSLRYTLSSTSSFITERVLKLTKPSLIERYTNVLFVFTLSGIVHIFQDIGYGKSNTRHQLGTLAFFQSFAFGIMIEDGVQELWRRFSGTMIRSEASEGTPLWRKVAGAIWVMVFISMVSPWYHYPQVFIPWEKRWIIPIDLTEKFGVSKMVQSIVVGALVLIFAFQPEI